MKGLTINKARLLSNAELCQRDQNLREQFASINIDPAKTTLEIRSGQLLIIDPIYLEDVYNEDNARCRYLKTNGVLLNDFGGESSGPILRTDDGGIKIFLVAEGMDEDDNMLYLDYPDDAETRALPDDTLGCDSGSYIFLDYSDVLKTMFTDELNDVPQLVTVIDLKPGVYGVGYEQYEITEEEILVSFRRNLVVFPIAD